MYLALARKYRPKTFKELIGQPHITKTLQNAIRMDKLYPALIFSGMKGVGKTSAARILAKAMNCEAGPAPEPCNKCAICNEINEDKSPDYIEIDGASNNGVEEVRSLREKIKYKPFKNRFRMIVIDEVHMLSNSAWNALLKTVEEPPEHTYFIMATTDFHKIPSTIVSRCQHFEFKRIPVEVITSVLENIVDKEKIEISKYGLYLIAKSADGSLRDSKKILDQAIAISDGKIEDKDVIDILGIIEEEIFIEITSAYLSRDRKKIILVIDDLTERGIDVRFFYYEYIKFLRNLMVLKSDIEIEKLHNLNPENVSKIKMLIKDLKEIELLRYFNAVKDLEITIKNTENPKIILEYLFIKLSYFPSLMSIEQLIENAGSGSKSKPVKSTPLADSPDITVEIKKAESADKEIRTTSKEDSDAVKTEQKKKEKPEQAYEKASDDNESIEKIKKDKQIKNLTSKIQGRIISIENLEGDK
ncbi:MAG: DNA polymerase III subunit gamma/tau [Candidatus Aminicenantes bacterium]|nr:DNA polymerase III subunit gamma/tau [Candidatus Aminicenantes bacterium]